VIDGADRDRDHDGSHGPERERPPGFTPRQYARDLRADGQKRRDRRQVHGIGREAESAIGPDGERLYPQEQNVDGESRSEGDEREPGRRVPDGIGRNESEREQEHMEP
jgi:hypothetical protein